MRWRDVDQMRRRALPVLFSRRDPRGIDGNGLEAQPCGLKRSFRTVIAGVLHPDALARIGQHAGA